MAGGLALGAIGGRARSAPPSTADVAWLGQGDAGAPGYAFNLRTRLQPALRALCRTEAGVLEALDFARREGMPFAVQSSGHCFEGLSQSRDLVIDVRGLNAMAFEQGGGSVTAGPGTTIGDLNGGAPAGAWVLPAGFCQTVALGGHVTGGGVGYLSRAFGLAADHLLTARIATAAGQVLDVGPDSHSDLFWALRGGGGGSFGIVTQLTCRLRPVPRAVFVDMVANVPDREAAEALAETTALIADAPRAVTGRIFVTRPQTGPVRINLTFCSVDEGAEEALATEARRLLPGAREQTTRGVYPTVADAIYPRRYAPQWHGRYGSDMLAGPPDASAWRDALASLRSGAGWETSMIVEALGGAISDKEPEATAFPHRRGTPLLIQYGTRRTDGATANRQARSEAAPDLADLRGAMRPCATGGAYICYPERQRPDWQRAYWGANYPRLQHVKARYDPDNLFRHALSVEPADTD